MQRIKRVIMETEIGPSTIGVNKPDESETG